MKKTPQPFGGMRDEIRVVGERMKSIQAEVARKIDREVRSDD